MAECLGLQSKAFLGSQGNMQHGIASFQWPTKGYSRHGIEKQRHFLSLGNPQQSQNKIAPGHSNLEEDRNTRKSCCYTICSLMSQLKYWKKRSCLQSITSVIKPTSTMKTRSYVAKGNKWQVKTSTEACNFTDFQKTKQAWFFAKP